MKAWGIIQKGNDKLDGFGEEFKNLKIHIDTELKAAKKARETDIIDMKEALFNMVLGGIAKTK